MLSTVSNSRAIKLTTSLVMVVLVSIAVGWVCLEWGQHGARQCAIDYPHDGQCGLVAMEGMAFAMFATPAVFIAGTIFAIWRWKSDSATENDASTMN